jgi:uncharacterized integral membrane protein
MAQSAGTGVHARGHVVVASADSEAFASLRRRSTSRLDRYRMGKQLRRQVPRSSLGDWSVQADRPDPVQLIIESHRGRLDWLIPLRVGWMTATPYGFLRGAATVMPSNPPPAPRRGRLHTRISAMRAGVIAGFAALIVVVIFSIQNPHAVNISFLGIHLVLPLAVALFLAAIAGALAMAAAGTARITQLRRIIRRDRPNPGPANQPR